MGMRQGDVKLPKPMDVLQINAHRIPREIFIFSFLFHIAVLAKHLEKFIH